MLCIGLDVEREVLEICSYQVRAIRGILGIAIEGITFKGTGRSQLNGIARLEDLRGDGCALHPVHAIGTMFA